MDDHAVCVIEEEHASARVCARPIDTPHPSTRTRSGAAQGVRVLGTRAEEPPGRARIDRLVSRITRARACLPAHTLVHACCTRTHMQNAPARAYTHWALADARRSSHAGVIYAVEAYLKARARRRNPQRSLLLHPPSHAYLLLWPASFALGIPHAVSRVLSCACCRFFCRRTHAHSNLTLTTRP